jgi:ABC-type transport system involved in cytochrome c biogenesis permease subunit
MALLLLSFAFYLFSLWKRPLLYIGFLLQTGYVISRGLELGRLPLVGPHDTIAFLAASIVAFYIPFSLAFRGRLQPFHNSVAVMVAVFTVIALVSKQHNSPLPPVLKTFWFETHVVLAFLSYALFGIAALFGYLNLSQVNRELEDLQYRAILIGYSLFTLSMVTGGIWAYLAWGTYWLWTPKELWTSILWLFYTLFLHVQYRQWWSGRPLSFMAIAGFGIVMFTYLGVSLLMKSSHSF